MSNVLVLFRPSAQGRAAVSQAVTLAAATDAHLCIVTVARQSSSRCRGIPSAYWNGIERELALKELAEARTLVPPGADVEYDVAVGFSERDALVRAARARAIAAVVVPARGRRWLRSRRLARGVSREAGVAVVTVSGQHVKMLAA